MALPLQASPSLFRVRSGPGGKRSSTVTLHLCKTLNPNSWFLSSDSNALRATTPLQKYSYPDPIPDFADAESQKFKAALLNKLLQEEHTFGDDLDVVVDTCAKMINEFLCKEYGGPGTLLVEPFTNMFVELKEKKLPGAAFAARAALLWAQNNVDQDWELWNSNSSK